MNPAFEHSSIRVALLNAGLLPAAQPNDAAKEKSLASIMFAWSSRENLLLEPEYAWLSLDSIIFVQLPQLRHVVLSYLEASRLQLTPAPEMELLSTELGQWKWAVEAAQVALVKEREGELPVRLTRLRRFASTHWPGWYEEALAALSSRLKEGTIAPADIQSLSEWADAVCVFAACRPLLDWSENEQKADRIAILRDALFYVMRGTAQWGDVLALAAEDTWWDELEGEMATSEAQLLSLRKGGANVGEVLGDRLKVMRDCLRQVSVLKEPAVKASTEETSDLYQASDNLIRTLREIVTLRNKTRAVMKSRR